MGAVPLGQRTLGPCCCGHSPGASWLWFVHRNNSKSLVPALAGHVVEIRDQLRAQLSIQIKNTPQRPFLGSEAKLHLLLAPFNFLSPQHMVDRLSYALPSCCLAWAKIMPVSMLKTLRDGQS